MMKHLELRKNAALTGLALTLMLGMTACGFHLRGNIPLPEGIKNMYVQVPTGSFRDELELILSNAGAVLAPSKAGAEVVLDVMEAQSDRQVGTLDDRGKVNSFNLIFSVTYELQDPQGKPIRQAALTESRRYNFDPNLVVESESEEADLQSDMERDIALRMVRQLSSITDYPAKPGEIEAQAVKDQS